jgi:hypothetical protein
MEEFFRNRQEVQNAVILTIQLSYRRKRRLLGAGMRDNYAQAVADIILTNKPLPYPRAVAYCTSLRHSAEL